MNLYIKDLFYSYEEQDKGIRKEVLSNVNLEFKKGERILIEGENGSGKTTFLKLLAGLLEAECGEIYLEKNRVGEDAYKKEMAYIPAKPIVFEELTGTEHIDLFCDMWRIEGEKKKNYLAKMRKFAEEYQLEQYMEEKVRTYSLGTKYKLFFLLMLAREPHLLLLDEPFTSLDEQMQEKAVEQIKKIGKEGIVVMTSHQKELMEQIATITYKITEKQIVKGKE